MMLFAALWIDSFRYNKTGLQPVSRTCGTTPFGFQDSRKDPEKKIRSILKSILYARSELYHSIDF